MSIEISADAVTCSMCGKNYSSWRINFYPCYCSSYKGTKHLTMCKACVEKLFEKYYGQCSDVMTAVRQMCRKLDLYWNETAFRAAQRKNTTKTIMYQYVATINTATYANRSYDDTLTKEGTLWSFSPDATIKEEPVEEPEKEVVEEEIDEDLSDFWGAGYNKDTYDFLESRKNFWLSRLPENTDVDVGTEGLISQLCFLELDMNRDRTAGKAPSPQSVSNFNTLLGSMNLKPIQKKDNSDSELSSTPLGVWLYRYENERPLPEIDDDLKDVNGIKKYVFTWMGHLCKMLGLKNGYSQLYEDEIARLRVDRPEYDDEDDETFFADVLNEGTGVDDDTG